MCKTLINSNRIKIFFGKIVGKIVTELYDILRKESFRLNIYTREVKTYSKAFKIFIDKSFNFTDETKLKYELLFYLINTEISEEFKKFFNDFKVLNFGFMSLGSYINCFTKHLEIQKISDEFKTLKANHDRSKYYYEFLECISLNGMIDIDMDQCF